MLLAQQEINRGSGRFFLSGYGYRKASRIGALVSILPAYLLSLFSHNLIVVVGVYLFISITLSVLLTIWVRKKPADSKWHYWLG